MPDLSEPAVAMPPSPASALGPGLHPIYTPRLQEDAEALRLAVEATNSVRDLVKLAERPIQIVWDRVEAVRGQPQLVFVLTDLGAMPPGVVPPPPVTGLLPLEEAAHADWRLLRLLPAWSELLRRRGDIIWDWSRPLFAPENWVEED